MPTSRSRAAVDAWVTDGAASLNIGRTNRLRVQDGTPIKYAFWKAKNPAPRGASIISAELRFFTAGTSGDTYDMHARRVAAAWTESDIDFDNAPGVTGATATVSFTETADAMLAFDVTAQVQTISDGAAYYGFRLDTDDTTERKFYSAQATDNQPYLLVEWADVPDAPTELSPSGGAAVTIAKPTLLFNFHDPVGDDMASLQVQINSTATMTSPDFDSGTVTSSDPELDLTATAFAGISAAATKYWRVRVQNAAGNWSPWSDVVHFTRVTRGALTVGSPTGNVIHDHTPTFIWSTTGTQTSWRLQIFEDSDPGDPIYDTDRRSNATGSHTLPKGVITDEDVTYRYRLRVWEDITRTSTPGDLIFTEDVDTFTFVEDPTPNAPTSVTVSQVSNGKPFAQLDIVRASAPDAFVILRNSKVVDVVDPVDIYLSGTTYRFIDRTAAPNHDWTYKVRSRVGGVAGPVRTGTPDPFSYVTREVWLADWTNPGSTRLVAVAVNLGDCSFDMPETGGTYSPVDGHDIATVRQSLKGLSGQIDGRIVGRTGLTADNQVGDMLWFKKHAPQNRLRMTLGAQNLEIEIRNVTLSPLGTSDPDARAVRFDFNSIGGPQQ